MPAAALKRAISPHAEERDDIVHLHDVSWQDDERILLIRGERSVPRVAYLEGTIEIMGPSRSHEQIGTFIARLVDAWCLGGTSRSRRSDHGR